VSARGGGNDHIRSQRAKFARELIAGVEVEIHQRGAYVARLATESNASVKRRDWPQQSSKDAPKHLDSVLS